MQKHTTHWLSPQVLGITLLCMTASFGVGIKTTGDVQTIGHTSATETIRLAGDMNADGIVDTEDVIRILEIVRGYESATAEQLLADPDADGTITIDDAIGLLHDIRSQSL